MSNLYSPHYTHPNYMDSHTHLISLDISIQPRLHTYSSLPSQAPLLFQYRSTTRRYILEHRARAERSQRGDSLLEVSMSRLPSAKSYIFAPTITASHQRSGTRFKHSHVLSTCCLAPYASALARARQASGSSHPRNATGYSSSPVPKRSSVPEYSSPHQNLRS